MQDFYYFLETDEVSTTLKKWSMKKQNYLLTISKKEKYKLLKL